MDRTNALKDFVQRTLGCGCPEEVLNHIESQADTVIDGQVHAGRINVGNRLLIYVVAIHEEESLEFLLPFLVEKGKTERDRLQFNRFRLVLATEEPDAIEKKARALFEASSRDEKIHLHTIKSDAIPDL